jgi:hypothetical protein
MPQLIRLKEESDTLIQILFIFPDKIPRLWGETLVQGSDWG